MDRFYVRFAGDNDFCNTVKSFMQAIAPRVLFAGEWRDITKEQVVALFNEHAFSLYALHQCFEVQAEDRLRAYLRIKVGDVYFDDEIDAFDNHNGDGCLAVEQHDGIGYYVM